MSTTIPLPASREPAALYRYSVWLHVGLGAEDCPEVNEGDGSNVCGDRSHFHAWCRLPNPLQQAEIRQRALAAKARKIRQLRDPCADVHEILEEELAGLAREGERARTRITEELLALDYWRDYYEAMMEVRQIDDESSEDDAKLYAHVEDDQARFMRLSAMPEADRPADEHAELEKHLARYQKALDAALSMRQEPKRDALDGLSVSELLEQLRDKRIEGEAQREFQRVFEIHEWLSCAYASPDGAPVLADLEILERAAPEIVAGLQATFTDLKRTAQDAQGN